MDKFAFTDYLTRTGRSGGKTAELLAELSALARKHEVAFVIGGRPNHEPVASYPRSVEFPVAIVNDDNKVVSIKVLKARCGHEQE